MAKKRKKIGSETFSEDLLPLVRPVEGLTLDPSNARLHSDRNIAAIRYSLTRFGQKKPIVANEKGVVLAGNGTLRAAVEAGWENIAVTVFRGSEAEEAAFAVADNRTAELGEWDDVELHRTLSALAEHGVDLSIVGFEEAEWADLVERIEGADDPPWTDPGANDPDAIGGYNEATDFYVIKIEKVAPKSKDDVLARVNGALQGTGLSADAY